ncbi:MAG: Gmad2 immunoglobulin-like domain-containing protein [Candidatus Doudnabacteria bacterium]|nr:Gmad2 immunoglobulin-like domain-containing protein [Candidatus Doudnabacteria bacterium]
MNNQLKNVIIVVLLVAVVGLLLVLLPKKDKEQPGQQTDTSDIVDFHTCEEAGYPVLETYPQQCRTPDGKSFTEDLSENAEVVINTPTRGATVKSPLTVTGKAKGNWFFEANIPVTLKDSNGKVLAQIGAQAQSDWMTTDYVNFTAVLNFPIPSTEFGVLLIEKDNPSGLPENDASYAIPVKFK